MRHTLLAAILPLVVAACGAATTEPYRLVTDAAPSGIAVASVLGPTRPDAEPLEATVAVSGDSVVFTYVFGGNACPFDFSATAGVVDGVLVVTHGGRFPDALRLCTADAPRIGPTFRLALRPPARGQLTVSLRQRVQTRSGGTEFRERELVRRALVLP